MMQYVAYIVLAGAQKSAFGGYMYILILSNFGTFRLEASLILF